MNYYIQLPVKYKCPKCGWIGYKDDMDFAACPAYYDRTDWTYKCSDCECVGTLDNFEEIE